VGVLVWGFFWCFVVFGVFFGFVFFSGEGILAPGFLECGFLCPSAGTIEEDIPSFACIPDTLQDSPFGNQKAALRILPSEQGFGWADASASSRGCAVATALAAWGTSATFGCPWSVQAHPVLCWGCAQVCVSRARELLTPLLWVRRKSGNRAHLVEPWCHLGRWQD